MNNGMFYDDKLRALAEHYPWPAKRPDNKPDEHGWFGWCHEELLGNLIGDDTKIILELGSWLGKSTRFLLGKCPSAAVIAVDHWLGTPQIAADDVVARSKIPSLYETFLSNCWRYRHRLIPMRTNTLEAITILSNLMISPDFIFLDASHEYEDVKADLAHIRHFFPKAQVSGDDYGGKWQGVKRAVDEMCLCAKCKVYSIEHAWAMVPMKFEPPGLTKPPPNQVSIPDKLPDPPPAPSGASE